MKMLFLSPALRYGGAHKMIVWIANCFKIDGNDVTILTYNEENKNKKLLPDIKKVCLDIPSEKNFWRRNFIELPKAVYFLCRYVKYGEFDVIFSFTDTVSIISMYIIKKLWNIKFYISERMDPYTDTGMSDRLRRKLFKYSDGIAFQTNEAKDYFTGKLSTKQCVIPNPVIIDFIDREVTVREQRIVSVGRLDIKQKRQDLLIRAFAVITKNYPEIVLELYGDGDDEYKIKEIISEYNLNKKVILAGVTDDVYKSIYNAKMFIMTSDFEGVPNALIEAMSMGIPVISTDCSPGGARTLIQNTENGLLIERNNVNELVKAIIFMLENPKKAEEMAKSAKRIREKYTEDKVFMMWKEFVGNNV